MLKACGIISLRVKRLVDMVCKFPICLWADLMRIGAEGSGPYAVVRDGLCLYAISRSSFPSLSGEKKMCERATIYHPRSPNEKGRCNNSPF